MQFSLCLELVQSTRVSFYALTSARCYGYGWTGATVFWLKLVRERGGGGLKKVSATSACSSASVREGTAGRWSCIHTWKSRRHISHHIPSSLGFSGSYASVSARVGAGSSLGLEYCVWKTEGRAAQNVLSVHAGWAFYILGFCFVFFSNWIQASTHWKSITLNSDSHSSTTPWSIANMFPHLQWSHLNLREKHSVKTYSV